MMDVPTLSGDWIPWVTDRIDADKRSLIVSMRLQSKKNEIQTNCLLLVQFWFEGSGLGCGSWLVDSCTKFVCGLPFTGLWVCLFGAPVKILSVGRSPEDNSCGSSIPPAFACFNLDVSL